MTDMKNWEIKKLGEVYDVRDGTHDSPKYVKEGYALITSKNLKNDNLNYNNVNYITEQDYTNINKRSKVDVGDILFAMIGTIGNPIVIKDEPDFAIKNVALFKVPKNQDSYFLKYYLDSGLVIEQMTKDAKGATQKFVGLGYLRSFPIPLPPLPEQQRIVAILDEAFSVIAKAKANAEQNLKNAKELFESYLQNVFENKGEGWEDQLLENCFKLKSGDNLTAKNMTEGEYPVFGGNGIAGYHNDYNLSGSNVIIGRVGALCGNVRHITENIWLTDNAFKVVDFKFEFDNSFLSFLLNYKDLRSFARQAAQPVISNSSLKDVALEFPKSLKEQQTIVQKLDALSAETKRLEAIYKQKINDLEELKKSVLQKAFNGELKTSKLV